MINTTTIIGVSGAALVLAAFVLSQLHEWESDYFIYEFFNFAGSALLVLYAVLLNSIPFIVLNVVWGGVAAYYALQDLIRNSHRKDIFFFRRRSFFQKWME